MTAFQAFILGIVQGITEFIPVSSSGHLVIFPELFGWDLQATSFDIVVHAATLLALLIYFRKDLMSLLNFKNQSSRNLLISLILVSIPAAIFGFFFEDFIDRTFKNTQIIIFMLIFLGVIMLFIDKITSNNNKTISKLTKLDAFLIGVFQSLAFIRGTSRSGVTIIGGQILGLKREQAAKFAFLAGIPIIGVAFIKQLFDFSIEGFGNTEIMPLIVGFISALVFGLVAINLLIRYLEKHTLVLFGIYRIILGLILLFLLK